MGAGGKGKGKARSFLAMLSQAMPSCLLSLESRKVMPHSYKLIAQSLHLPGLVVLEAPIIEC